MSLDARGEWGSESESESESESTGGLFDMPQQGEHLGHLRYGLEQLARWIQTGSASGYGTMDYLPRGSQSLDPEQELRLFLALEATIDTSPGPKRVLPPEGRPQVKDLLVGRRLGSSHVPCVMETQSDRRGCPIAINAPLRRPPLKRLALRIHRPRDVPSLRLLSRPALVLRTELDWVQPPGAHVQELVIHGIRDHRLGSCR